jgi:hypothetical protein
MGLHCYPGCEEHSESRFDNMALIDTPTESAWIIPQATMYSATFLGFRYVIASRVLNVNFSSFL